MPECDCIGTGMKTGFAIGIGPYPALCECHKECPQCKGTGRGEPGFAIGIGPYPTNCTKCKGKGIVPKNN